jgi:hypothetical protein
MLLFVLLLHVTECVIPGVLCNLIYNEANEDLVEWVEHHENLGFRIIFYDHHSTTELNLTSSVTVLKFPDMEYTGVKSDEMGKCIEFTKNRNDNAAHLKFPVCQLAAFQHCLDMQRRLPDDNANKPIWIGNWDVDEFVYVDTPGKNNTSIDFWGRVNALGTDSIEFQCLRFGTKKTKSVNVNSVRQTNRHRGPYAYLGDKAVNTCAGCQTIGAEKLMSKLNAVHSLHIHAHLLYYGKIKTDWLNAFYGNLQCNHYLFRSKKYTLMKHKRNSDHTYANMLMNGALDEDTGFYNEVLDERLALMSL